MRRPPPTHFSPRPLPVQLALQLGTRWSLSRPKQRQEQQRQRQRRRRQQQHGHKQRAQHLTELEPDDATLAPNKPAEREPRTLDRGARYLWPDMQSTCRAARCTQNSAIEAQDFWGRAETKQIHLGRWCCNDKSACELRLAPTLRKLAVSHCMRAIVATNTRIASDRARRLQ